jgi:hypothetical protein
MGGIMTLLPPPENRWTKAMLIGIFTILFILEIQSLYKASDDSRNADERIMNHFDILILKLDSVQQKFSDLIDKETDIINRLDKQKKLQEKTFEKVTEREGALVPSNLPNPVCGCPIPNGQTAVYFAGGAVWNMKFPYTVLRLEEENIISLDKDKRGGLLVSAKVFDDRGDLIAKIEKNKFIATYTASHFKKTKSELIVYDHKDKIGLLVRFTNRYSVEIEGNFHYTNGDFEIYSDSKQLILKSNYTSIFSSNCKSGGNVMFNINKQSMSYF